MEWQVAEFLCRNGWTKLFHDARVMRVQVDLIMRDPRGLLTVIEVKSDGASGMAHIPRRQMGRLMRVCGFLARWEPVELRLALVAGRRLRLLPVDALTAR